MDSTMSPNNNTTNNNQNQSHHPNPLMHYPTSSEHGRINAFNVLAFASRNNTALVQIPHSHSSFSSRNLVHGVNCSHCSQPSWVNNCPGLEDIKSAMGGMCLSSDPRMENIQSAMGGLCLSSDPVTRSRSSDDLSGDYLDYLEWDEICDSDSDSDDEIELETLSNTRVESAATTYSSVVAGVGGNSNRVIAAPLEEDSKNSK